MANRFDVEQEILKFSQIMDDIAELNLDSKELESILAYYNHRYEKLWSTFEQSIRDDANRLRDSAFISKAQIVPVTRIEIIDETGRAYSKWNIQNKNFSFQDDNKTLKIFLNMHGTAADSEGGQND